ncbi:MAG: response regulator [Fimbriimonadaceae bacterium]|nr:response regulator [Fimbriimonadaceae bacterium]
MPDPIRIVIIEDESPIRRFLKASLEPETAEWLEAETGGQGTRLVAQKNPDLVLLDLGLPDQDGLEVLRDLREWTDVPVIVLTARGQEKDKVLALDAGADDYVTKPFSVPELMARIRVALRHAARGKPEFEPTFESGGLKVDFERRLVTLNGEEVRLTPIEYRLVALLARHAGKVLTHRHLLTEIWGASYEDSTHTLRVHMGSIRQKIEADPSHPRYIRTETGVGYRMMVDP